ncbi:NADH-quinone oxidoreductase subunit G [Oceanitalea stevensii]|uniref:NADH-quinone oxidoreductase subunit G n=1 Tax=Oceanitalea stevensii TaxID=2763072 RepID=A0ABR8Z0W9_9MICO|nr:NADH-quinone oxidoreductase subunit G [Oceanitalea stevensii]MBD8061678.1 NADH-quinone oxidoreductase subunit G [Oceanitalea stevensii]
MTTTASTPATTEQRDLLTVTIDGVEVDVPKGTLVIRAAEQVGIQIPRFCDHPLLKPAGACRQCLVEVSTPDREGNLRAMPKPQTSCTLEATPGMVVATQHTSAVADKAQHGMIEFLLINHPLDCPVCDKGGECPLQNQAMTNGRATTRFVDIKRTFPKPLKISSEILLDRDRCILCQRCTRFSDQIAGDPFIALQGRGGGTPGRDVHATHGSQIGTFDADVLDFAYEGGEAQRVTDRGLSGPVEGEPGVVVGLSAGPVGVAETDTTGRPFSSYFSGNTIQICPVGALTSATYRFRARPFDLISTESVAEHDAGGSAIRVDHRRGVVVRRLAGDDAEVNEEWITDKDRFAFTWQSAPDRLEYPLVRDEDTGELVETSWSEALHLAARGLERARSAGGVGVLPGGRLTLEDSYAWSRFARTVLGTNDVDHRARPSSAEEADFLARRVAGAPTDVTFSALEHAGHVLLVGLEPEEESGTMFLRLRKGVLAGTVAVSTVAPFATRGTTKLRASLLPAVPGAEAAVLDSITPDATEVAAAAVATALTEPGAVVLVGERAGALPGVLTAVERLVDRTGARLAWVPRRAGERGAVEAGLLPALLPGGRHVSDAEARVDVAAAWGVDRLPSAAGRDLTAILEDTAAGRLGGLLVGGVELRDLPDPALARRALAAAGVVVQLEVRRSEVTEHADVVLPVAPPVEKGGTFVNWEGRRRPFGQVLVSHQMADQRVLDALAAEMGTSLGCGTLADVHAQLTELAGWQPAQAPVPAPVSAAPAPAVGEHQAVLATWKLQLDAGRGQDGEPHLAGTAHRPVLRLSADRAARLGAVDGTAVTVRGPAGSITLPLAVTTMSDDIVWVPENSPGSHVHEMLGAGAGSLVDLEVTR